MPSKDIIACNGFGFKGGWGTLTERVVAHPTTLSPFPQVFLVTGESQTSYAKFKLPSIEKESYVPTYVFNEVTLCILSLKYLQTGILSSCNAYCL